MSDNPLDFGPIEVPLDLSTGNVIYKGQTYTLHELLELLEEEKFAQQDALEELRDFTLDGEQNLWGRKQGGRNGTQYRDDWYGRKRGYRRRKGYPKDLGY